MGIPKNQDSSVYAPNAQSMLLAIRATIQGVIDCLGSGVMPAILAPKLLDKRISRPWASPTIISITQLSPLPDTVKSYLQAVLYSQTKALSPSHSHHFRLLAYSPLARIDPLTFPVFFQKSETSNPFSMVPGYEPRLNMAYPPQLPHL